MYVLVFIYVYVLCACRYVCFECNDNGAALVVDRWGGGEERRRGWGVYDDRRPTRGGPVGLLDTAVTQVEGA